jgi:hypothetical protein
MLSRDINPVLRLLTADFLGRRKLVVFAMRCSVRPSAAFILAQRSLSTHFSLTQIDLSERLKASRRFLVVINAPLTDAVSSAHIRRAAEFLFLRNWNVEASAFGDDSSCFFFCLFFFFC